jgi:hypothetical protein
MQINVYSCNLDSKFQIKTTNNNTNSKCLPRFIITSINILDLFQLHKTNINIVS